MRFQALTLLAAVSLLAACSTAPDTSATAGGTGSAAAPASSGIRAGSQQDLAATAGDRVYFAYDKSDISPEARAILTKQADWLKKNANVTVTVEGHCDERGTRALVLGAAVLGAFSFGAFHLWPAGPALIGSAQAQDNRDLRPLLDRLDRMERDMNQLQRQVYRGGSASGAPVPAPAPDAGTA